MFFKKKPTAEPNKPTSPDKATPSYEEECAFLMGITNAIALLHYNEKLDIDLNDALELTRDSQVGLMQNYRQDYGRFLHTAKAIREVINILITKQKAGNDYH